MILASRLRAVFTAGMLLVAADAAAQPCTRAVPSCTEFVEFAGPSTRILIYRTHPLDQKNADITRALVVVHGAGRDADNYFRHVLAGAYLAEALDNTVVVSMRFASNDGLACRDTLDTGELNWQCGGPGRWTAGGTAIGTSSGLFPMKVNVTSFDAADEVVRKLRKRDVFPNLRAIVVSGHSAGGQFVSRYQMANQVHDTSGAPMTYIVANPSSYAYPDNLRPTASAVPANSGAAPPGYVPPLAETPPPPFVPYADAPNCTTYDQWPYGLLHRVGYAARIPDGVLKKQLAARPATYLLGGLDILPLFGFDGSCAARAQGPTRLARGLAFARHVTERYLAEHQTLIVPSCGHNARCMFTADDVLPLLFPK